AREGSDARSPGLPRGDIGSSSAAVRAAQPLGLSANPAGQRAVALVARQRTLERTDRLGVVSSDARSWRQRRSGLPSSSTIAGNAGRQRPAFSTFQEISFIRGALLLDEASSGTRPLRGL